MPPLSDSVAMASVYEELGSALCASGEGVRRELGAWGGAVPIPGEAGALPDGAVKLEVRRDNEKGVNANMSQTARDTLILGSYLSFR